MSAPRMIYVNPECEGRYWEAPAKYPLTDDIEYVRADLVGRLVGAADAYLNKYGVPASKEGWAITDALAAFREES